MYERLKVVGSKLPIRRGRVLAISHSANLCQTLGLEPTEVVEANYPDHNMLALDFPDESFDFVLSDQVLEHIEGSPQQAFDECWRVLRPGGIAVHTTVFVYPVHNDPGDFWRYTPAALRLLSSKFSEVLECTGWGNFEVWSLYRAGLGEELIPNARWHPLHWLANRRNDPNWPLMVWVVARK